jgi:small conductance mechanosensitive channel
VAPLLPGLGGPAASMIGGPAPSTDTGEAASDGRTTDGQAADGQAADGGEGTDPGMLPASDRLLMRTLGFLAERLTEAGDALSRMVSAFEDAPQVLAWVERQVTNDVARERWLGIFMALGMSLAVGLAVRLGVFLLIRRGVHGLDRRAADGRWLVRLPLVVARVILEVLPLIAFVASASAALTLIDPDRSAQLATLTVINAVLLGGVIRMASRVTLAPETPSLRLVPLTDETAAYLHHWLRRLGVIAIYGWFAAEVLFLLGVPSTVRAVLIHLLGLVITGLLIVFVLQNRAPVARMIRGDGRGGAVSTARRRLGDIWPILAIAYLVVAFVVWLLDVGEGGFEFVLRATVFSLLIIAAAQGAGAAISRLIDRGFRVSARMRERLPGLERRANRYLPALRRIAGWIIGIAAVLGILQVWGMGGVDWVTSGSGRAIAARLIVIGFVIALLLGAWEVLNALIRRFLERTDESGTTIVASNRVRTLLPLLRNVAMIVLGTIGVLVVLSELGINIAPLLAGAGVVGLAIGFGAQALVSDVITGLFILLEDTIQVGDVVDVGGHAGVVESLSIRAIKLRDLSGNVHTVPFGQVSAVLNMTKEFSYYVFDIGVAYREDTDQVSRIIEEIGAEMQQDETYGAQILAPIEILGVDAFADSAVIVKARIKTKPIQQWFVGREFNRRLKKRFDAEGIEIPFPHVTLYFGEDKQGNAPPGRLNIAAPEVIEALAADGDRLKRGRKPDTNDQARERGPERGQALPGDDTSSDLTGGGEPEN